MLVYGNISFMFQKVHGHSHHYVVGWKVLNVLFACCKVQKNMSLQTRDMVGYITPLIFGLLCKRTQKGGFFWIRIIF